MKNFGFGVLVGGVIGVVLAYVKNPNTGNTIKHDLKVQIDDTIADSQNIADAKKRLDESLDYLKTDGMKKVQQFSDFMEDRMDGFEMQIKPNLEVIEDKLDDLEITLENYQDDLDR